MRSAARVEIEEEDASSLAEYARISVAFEVRVVMDARASTTSRTNFILDERQCSTPFVKDYDGIPNNAPIDWRVAIMRRVASRSRRSIRLRIRSYRKKYNSFGTRMSAADRRPDVIG